MKYIILDSPSGEAPVLFPREFLHRYVADLFAPMRVAAAGFVRIGVEGVECYGESAGLRIRSRPGRDTALLHDALAPWPADVGNDVTAARLAADPPADAGLPSAGPSSAASEDDGG